jgi:hypothetical protein
LKTQWLSFGASIFISVASLSACESLPEALGQSTPVVASSGVASSVVATEQETPADALAVNQALEIKHFVDISGCWRPVGASLVYSDGAPFTIFAIANNTFIIGKDAHTSLVVSENFGFVEGNRDPDKPYFPPGYIHSTGTVSKDGGAISRNLVGQSGSKEYRRCANVQQAPPELRNPDAAPDADPSNETPVSGGSIGATPSPKGTIAPLISRLNPSPSPSPVQASPEASEPTPAPSSAP